MLVIMSNQPGGYGMSSNQPATYRIRVQGRIIASWSDRFEGMEISTTPSTQEPAVTTLLGTVSDQAALVGVFNSLHELLLTVLSVECLDDRPAQNVTDSADE